ncbi:hypothetical protein LBMAG56_00160 [Verrucomicrobiota bacterium]|nr:hypothetical protein LBMAG56_00160 [Verrucomicrobiota bacterium]
MAFVAALDEHGADLFLEELGAVVRTQRCVGIRGDRGEHGREEPGAKAAAGAEEKRVGHGEECWHAVQTGGDLRGIQRD